MGLKEDGELVVGYLSSDGSEGRFSLSPEPSEVVTFTLFTREHVNGTTADIGKIFDKSKPTKFVTHGWLSSGIADTCVKIKNGFLQKYDANVFIMDWSEISGNVIYPIPMAATKGVGEYYSEFINNLVDSGVDPQTIHLVGHSLGAHVSGFAARRVKGKIGRVTGLDPALPGFNSPELVDGGHLNKSDADFVDVIHTCAGYLGMKMSIGDADFYPNGGSVPQPGCGSVFEMIEACSHGRSWEYFAASLVSSIPFMAYRCDSFDTFLQKEECKEEGVAMGDPTPVTAKGDYYLKTRAEEPFVVKEVEKSVDNALDK
ncbi:hypothetical protein MTP99_016671 [Tenebrio molitor]|nr:hypothetical protein MTP99_016671 [Tenebrio molitor]